MGAVSTAPSALQPVVQQSTPSMIASRVRGAIAAGEFPPGAQLHEAELARALGVSRGPLREGLQRLTQEGLLTSVRNRGLFVVELTPEIVRDMYLAREAVERCAAATLIARGAHEAAAAELGAVVDTMEGAAENGDSRGVAEADIRFHETLVAHAGSERLSRMHLTQAAEARLCIHALGSTYENDRARVREHRAIAAAIAAAEADRADALLVQHMAGAVTELVALSEQELDQAEE